MSIFDVADIVDHIFTVGNLIEPHVRCVCKAFNRAQRRKLDDAYVSIGCRYTVDEVKQISDWCVSSTFEIFKWYYEYGWVDSEYYYEPDVFKDDHLSDAEILANITWLRKHAYDNFKLAETDYHIFLRGRYDLFVASGFTIKKDILLDPIIGYILTDIRALTCLPRGRHKDIGPRTIKTYMNYFTDNAIDRIMYSTFGDEFLNVVINMDCIELYRRITKDVNTNWITPEHYLTTLKGNKRKIYFYLVDTYGIPRDAKLMIMAQSRDMTIYLSMVVDCLLDIPFKEIIIDRQITVVELNKYIMRPQIKIGGYTIIDRNGNYLANGDVLQSIEVFSAIDSYMATCVGIADQVKVRYYYSIYIYAIYNADINILIYLQSIHPINDLAYVVDDEIYKIDNIDIYNLCKSRLHTPDYILWRGNDIRTLSSHDVKSNIFKHIYPNLDIDIRQKYTDHIFKRAMFRGDIEVLNTIKSLCDIRRVNVFPEDTGDAPLNYNPISAIWYRRTMMSYPNSEITLINRFKDDRSYKVQLYFDTIYYLYGIKVIIQRFVSSNHWIDIININEYDIGLLRRLIVNGDINLPNFSPEALKSNKFVSRFIISIMNT